MHRASLHGLPAAARTAVTGAVLVLLVLPLAGCSAGDDASTAAASQAETWQAVQKQKDELEAKRTDLAAKRAELAAAKEGGEDGAVAAETEEAPPAPADLEAEIARLEDEIVRLQDAFGTALAEWINNAGIVEGQELTPEQRQAFNWKSHEDVLLAQEFIDKGGDYQRAIDIYEQALLFDPGNEEAQTALATAQERRYPTKERFDLVKKGMGKDEVKEILGQVNLRNVQEYPENDAIGWFYRKVDGGAAGVFFREKTKGAGDWTVYAATWDAARPGGAATG